MKRRYTEQEVESIVNKALQEQREEMEHNMEMQQIWEAIESLQEEVEQLKANNVTKVGF